MALLEKDLDPSLPNVWTPKKKEIEIYLSFNNSLSVTDFYSSYMDANDTKALRDGDITERYLKLKQYIRYVPKKELTSEDLLHHFTGLCESNQLKDWEAMMLLCYRKNHIIQSVIDGCIKLISVREYKKVAELLSKSWMKLLGPLIVLLTWHQCSCFSDAVSLLESLLSLGNVPNFLSSACQKLVNKNKHTEWCIDKVREFVRSSSKCFESSSMDMFFRGLRASSLLYALNDTKLIVMLKYNEITYMLENQPNWSQNEHQLESISIEQDVYCCFYVLKNLLDLTMASICGTLVDFNGQKLPITKELVLDYVSDLRFIIENISSLPLKVELLENIFSLLFLRRSDFKHQPSEDIDSDNISVVSNLSRTLSRSLDSLLDDHGDNHESSFFVKKNDLLNSVLVNGQIGLQDSISVQDVSESSCCTVKSAEDKSTVDKIISNMPPGFVSSSLILKKVLSFISEEILLITSKYKNINNEDANSFPYPKELERRLSKISNYTSEAQWRLELVTGVKSATNGKENESKAVTFVSQMLGSSESLVYLTMRKQNVVQAEQVLRMYDLREHACYEEVDFMKVFSSSVDKLRSVSLSNKPIEITSCPLDMIRSNTSAGKITSEATQIAESLLQHPVVVKSIHDFPMVDAAVCFDLLFSVPLSSSICKSLLDLASIKSEICDEDEYIHTIFMSKLKVIKSFLLLMNTKKCANVFEWSGHQIPTDFLRFYIHLPKNIYPETGTFSISLFEGGKDAFDELNSFIKNLYDNHTELVEENLDPDDSDILMSKAKHLFSIFTADTLAKLNNTRSVYDYMKSLIKYVNKFSRWKLNYKGNDDIDEEPGQPPGKILKAANPFLVFNEDISNTFGRLLFDWGVPPKKLESFAVHTNIKLVKIIAERCGVFVASNKKQSQKCEWSLLFQKHIVLNNSYMSNNIDIGGTEPTQIIEDILTSVIDVRNKALLLHDVTPEICRILDVATYKLAKMDADDTSLDSSCLINIFNILFLHSILLIINKDFDSKYGPEELLHLLNRPFGRLILYNHLSYNLGNLGTVSALDLYRKMVKCECASSYFGVHVDSYFSNIFSLQQLFIDNLDFNSCFPILHEVFDISAIPLFHQETLKNLIEKLPLKYLEDNIRISENKAEINITKFIFLHKQCFISYLNELEEKRVSEKHLMEIDKTGEQSDVDDGYVSNELNGIVDNVTIVNNGMNNNYQNDSDDSCASESNGNDDDIQILLTSLSNFANLEFSKSIKMALEKRYTIKIEKQNTCLSNNSITNESHFHHPVVQRTQTFSHMSSDVSAYLADACQLGGTLIELCLVKNQVLKQLTTIFTNNVLYNSVNEKDKMFSVFVSLQDGLKKFEKFTNYNSLKNIVVESSNYLESFMEHAEDFELSLPSPLMNRFYSSLQNVFCDKFLQTLSPDHWSEIVPVLLECSFYSKYCWKIILSNLELFLPVSKELFEILLCHSISELNDIIFEIPDSTHTIKRLIMFLDNSGNMFDNIRRCEPILPIEDIIDLAKACCEEENASNCEEVKVYLERCKWYKEVFHLDHTNDKFKFPTWQKLKQFVEEDPESTLQILMTAQCNLLIIRWYENFDLPGEIMEQCLLWKLKLLLNDDNIDYLTLQYNLDKVESDELCLRICKSLIAENEVYNCHNLFVIQYMTNMLAEILDPAERSRLLLNKIGILLIEMIPFELQDSYHCLQNNPLLIVEQLLMNMKIKLAEKALECIHQEVDGEEMNEVANLSSECDELVARYAQLALDLSGLEQNRSMDSLDDLSNSESTTRERRWSTTSQSTKKEKENYSPLQPVDRKKWVRDNDVVSCMLCRDLFNMFNRRHHCRHCGRVTCKACSPYYCYMVKYKRKARTCLKCYASNYQKSNSDTVESNNIIYDVPHDFYVFDTPAPFTFTCNEDENEEIRTSFVYEKAPSATLCLSIVDLRTNHCAAAGLLIKFSKSVSEYLHERHEGIDLTVVAKIIELILYHAKLKFLKCGDFDGIELTESYCSQIETVKTLVESNWSEIPTMLELTQSESLRRLRDQLIEKEHYNLANEVTKNSGVDLTINFIMGLSRLKYGDLQRARVYFARCLTMTQGEKLGTFGSNQHYLVRIIEEIENSLFMSINHVTKVDDALLPLPHVMVQQSQFQECLLMDGKRYVEILFYLTTYGSHGHILNFFFKNRLFKKAANLLRAEKCTAEQFVNHLLMPAFQEGCFEEFCKEMNFDVFHRFWIPIIHHSCKHLSKQGLYHCLYELQLVIKDLFRAALTCVRFFLGIGDPPRSYSQLNSRLKYLHLASSHLENVLKEKNRSKFVVGYSLLSEDKETNKEVPVSDIKRHLSTIKLQIEVTNFVTSPEHQIDLKKVFTLFGNGKERAELVAQLLLNNADGTVALISKIINQFKLPILPIVIRAVKKIVNDGKYELVSSLVQELEQCGLTTSTDNDEIFLQAVKVMVAANQNKSANQFIKLMKNDVSKINALILCGHLREAYLEAVKNERFQYIENILEEAKKVGQRNMIDICEKWLKNYKEKGAKK